MAESTQWRIVQRFPQLRAQIVDRLVTDPEFRALCHDYDECLTALSRFQNEAKILPDRIGEYERLQDALESEIHSAIMTDGIKENE